MKRYMIRARVLPDGLPQTIIGRDAWALERLLAAGACGCTPIDEPAPRWSHYVFKLRHTHGLVIETVEEPHGGRFAGTHARYVLRSEVEILPADAEREAA
ncbi:winged helix domain-containing protein [Antarcticirhabdus aurantiaca]|uniref:Uncharacterized protein n=1 Tax=Antarcticirhabdus aurantiaca TaxID=2606717 RepID=A0ACD4NME2_9HYPH|nr:hypothetical protein [Antarcticirhabdus aurantiaca]WAJ28023.1 hypothetical protein OXU80_24880 [Jeongeuplla avenae]